MNAIIPKTTSEYEKQYQVSVKAANIVNKLMSEEERKMMESSSNNLDMNFDAVILYTLFKSYGFTAEQLKAFYDEVNATLKAEIKTDEYVVNYGIIPQRTALKEEAGIDIKALYEEAESNG